MFYSVEKMYAINVTILKKYVLIPRGKFFEKHDFSTFQKNVFEL